MSNLKLSSKTVDYALPAPQLQHERCHPKCFPQARKFPSFLWPHRRLLLPSEYLHDYVYNLHLLPDYLGKLGFVGALGGRSCFVIRGCSTVQWILEEQNWFWFWIFCVLWLTRVGRNRTLFERWFEIDCSLSSPQLYSRINRRILRLKPGFGLSRSNVTVP